ncbi:hypothetical protein INR49_018834%2C partial, partial [Scomber scombrus]
MNAVCETYTTDVKFKKAVSANGRKEVELPRKDLRAVDAALPSHWDDMKGDLLKLFPVTAGSKEYNDVQTELTKTGLSANIISIERVQNETLWQSYQLMKKQLEAKNKHKNNEKMLFHGTGSNSIDHINKQGFNRSYAGAHEVREDDWEELSPDIAALHRLRGLSEHMFHERLKKPLNSRRITDQNLMSLMDDFQDSENFTARVIQMEQ